MFTIELIAVFTTLWCVWLTRNENILSWPIGIIACVAYFIVFLNAKLYSDMTLQLFFIAQSIYGWYNWAKPADNVRICEYTDERFASGVSFTFIGSTILGLLISIFTDSQQPYIDAAAASLSLLANWYLTKKVIQSWYIWIAVDALLSCLFVYKGLYSSAVLYFVLLILAIISYIKWRNELNQLSYEKIKKVF